MTGWLLRGYIIDTKRSIKEIKRRMSSIDFKGIYDKYIFLSVMPESERQRVGW